MDRLYIIGNGFDLYHGFPTKYSDFAKHLQAQNPDLLELIHRYYSLDSSMGLWANFEENLADLDKDGLLTDLTNYLPTISSNDFRDRDWYSFSIEVSRQVGALTHDLCEEFRNFINSATSIISENDNGLRLQLQCNSKYLSFNYSDTLELYYSIPESNITYIHGKAQNWSNSIILGHGINPDEFKVKAKEQPEGLSGQELERSHEYMSDNYDYSYEQGVEEAYDYYVSSFKNTEQIIESNKEFFSSLMPIKNVYILGHSLSEIDIPYFQKIYESLPSSCQWHVSFRGEDEYLEKREIVINIGVPPQFVHMIEFDILA